MYQNDKYAVLVDKFAVLDALEEAREEVVDSYERGLVRADATLRQLIGLYRVTRRVNELPLFAVKHDGVSRETASTGD